MSAFKKILVFTLVYLFVYIGLVWEIDKFLKWLSAENGTPFYSGLFSSLFTIFLLILPIIIGIRFLVKTQKKPIRKVDKPVSGTAISLQTSSGSLFIQNPFRGIFVVGAAGSGKSESVAIPLLKEFIQKGFSGIVYDFKYPALANEVQNFVGTSHSETQVRYISFQHPHLSHKVNPLKPEYLPNTSYAREYAQAIINNLMRESIKRPDFWSRSATDLLTAIIWFLREEYPQYCDLPHAFAMATSSDEALIRTLQKNPVTAQMTMSIYNALERNAANQLAGVVSTLQSVISQINTPEIMYIFSGDEVNLDINNPLNPSILVIGNNPTLANTYAPLCSLIITVATKLMNQPHKKPSFILLDEAPTVFIPNLEVLPNTGRSNQISTVLVCQDISQLVDGYGKEKADVLFAACNNHFYGRVSSSHTSELLSRQFGKEDRSFTTQSTGKSSRSLFDPETKTKGQSETIQERDIIRPAEFLNLRVGEFAGILVEGNRGTFREQFVPLKKEASGTMANNLTADKIVYQDTGAYYRKVREEVQTILFGKEESSLETDLGFGNGF